MVLHLSDGNLPLGAKALKTMSKKSRKVVGTNLMKVASEILRDATYNAPAQSGALRRSGRIVRRGDFEVEVGFGGRGTAVDYAIFVELGTRHQAPKLYLKRAVDKHKKKLVQLNEKAIKVLWSQASASVGTI